MKNRTATVELTDCCLQVSTVHEGASVVVCLINAHTGKIVENWSGGAVSPVSGWDVATVHDVAYGVLDRHVGANSLDVAELSRAIAFVVGVQAPAPHTRRNPPVTGTTDTRPEPQGQPVKRTGMFWQRGDAEPLWIDTYRDSSRVEAKWVQPYRGLAFIAPVEELWIATGPSSRKPAFPAPDGPSDNRLPDGWDPKLGKVRR